MRKRLILLFTLTMCMLGLYAQIEPRGNLIYCNVIDEGVAHMGTDYGTLTVEPGKTPKIEIVLHERCHFAECIKGDYEVLPSIVKELQKLIHDEGMFAINNYVEEEMIEGGHEYSVLIKYDSGDVISARWHTTSPNSGASNAYAKLRSFFAPWFEKLESGITTENLPKMRTSNKSNAHNANTAKKGTANKAARKGAKKKATYKRH